MSKQARMSHKQATNFFNLARARQREAQRRLNLLGSSARTACQPTELRERARTVGVPFNIFWNWHTDYKTKGVEGILPNWQPLDESEQALVMERWNQIGALADQEFITKEELEERAQQLDWPPRRLTRWLARYRAFGLWGLAPKNPTGERPPSKKRKRRPRALAALEEGDRRRAQAVITGRLEKLGELANKENVSDVDVKARAKETGVSPRSIWSYLTAFRDDGLEGLARRTRSDKGNHHVISDRTVEIVKGIRLSHPDLRARAVYEMALERATLLGEVAPSKWQVRSILREIPEAEKLIADGRRDEFRNKFRITHDMVLEGGGVIYQIDNTLVDILVQDKRTTNDRNTSGEVRPWLTLVIDFKSRLVLSYKFGYDQSDRYRVGAALHDAFVITPQKPYGGLPDQVWTDNGKDFLAEHVRTAFRDLGINLKTLPPHQPQLKGIVERFFGVLNTRLWSTLPGYVNSNTVKRNPNAKAVLTIQELNAKLGEFINKYNNEIHSALGETPIAYWQEHCYALPGEPEKLAILLKEREVRPVSKQGIHFGNRLYWDVALGTVVDKSIVLRAEPYGAADYIEVFYDDHWLCTAYATDSKVGLAVTREGIAAAQNEQKTRIRESIEKSRAVLREADRKITSAMQKGVGGAIAKQKSTPRRKSPASENPSNTEDMMEILERADRNGD